MTPQAVSVLGIIPARGGSKGVPRKNIRLLAGRPLLAYTLDAAKQSQRLTRFIVSTEDTEIAAVAHSMGCEVMMRPVDLAADDTPTLPVVIHVVKACQTLGETYDYIVILQPTTPLRTAEDIDASLELLIESQADAAVSVTKVPGHYHPDWQFTIQDRVLQLYNGEPLEKLITRRQLLSDTYTRNGAIYAVRTSHLLEHNTLFSPDTHAYIMPENRSVNIDSESDFAVAEYFLNRKTAF